MKYLVLILCPFFLAAWPSRQDEAAGGAAQNPVPAGQEHLLGVFEQAGIGLDLKTQVCSIPARVEVSDELLEYLLVLMHGAAHESLFVIGHGQRPEELVTWTELFNTALLMLGLERGTNARWEEKDPAPTEEELRAGVGAYDVIPPGGNGLYLYAAWREQGETYFYRMEDLIRDVSRGRTMRRHRWVYLGSRMVEKIGGGGEVFAAAMEGNLINIAFFAQGNTLFTGALPECINQTSWLGNAWLLPPRGSEVLLLFSKQPLESLPDKFRNRLPGGEGGGR